MNVQNQRMDRQMRGDSLQGECAQPKYLFLRHRWAHWAQHGGYDQLFPALERAIGAPQVSVNRRRQTDFGCCSRYLLGHLRRYAWGTLSYTAPAAPAAELQAILAAKRRGIDIVHVADLENDYGLLGSRRVRHLLSSTHIVATAHQPTTWWRLHSDPALVSRLDALIVLAESEVPFFSEFLAGRVHHVPHGIDTDFFRPGRTKPGGQAPLRCLFVGEYFRDIHTLAQVIELLAHEAKPSAFDIVYPGEVPCQPQSSFHRSFYRILQHPFVTWHRGVADETLLRLYQEADLLVLPLLDCTANNAILEAMACGLPMVTTALPGIRSYVTDSFAHLVNPGDARSMADFIRHVTRDPSLLTTMSNAARLHAEKNFTWDRIAARLLDVYAALG